MLLGVIKRYGDHYKEIIVLFGFHRFHSFHSLLFLLISNPSFLYTFSHLNKYIKMKNKSYNLIHWTIFISIIIISEGILGVVVIQIILNTFIIIKYYILVQIISFLTTIYEIFPNELLLVILSFFTFFLLCFSICTR